MAMRWTFRQLHGSIGACQRCGSTRCPHKPTQNRYGLAPGGIERNRFGAPTAPDAFRQPTIDRGALTRFGVAAPPDAIGVGSLLPEADREALGRVFRRGAGRQSQPPEPELPERLRANSPPKPPDAFLVGELL